MCILVLPCCGEGTVAPLTSGHDIMGRGIKMTAQNYQEL
jgi:hypothetical protein